MAGELPPEGGLKAFVGGGAGAPLALCVGIVGGKPYAVDNQCPHARAPLAAGRLCGTALTCPVHGWQWDLVTGKPLHSGDPALQTYEVRLYDGAAYVRIPD